MVANEPKHPINTGKRTFSTMYDPLSDAIVHSIASELEWDMMNWWMKLFAIVIKLYFLYTLYFVLCLYVVSYGAVQEFGAYIEASILVEFQRKRKTLYNGT